jgi:DNA polymerase-3 subunit epsilon
VTLFRSPIVVLDTETTGFQEMLWARVVELAAVRLDLDGNLADTFASLVRPEIHDARSAGAERVHGLTRAMLADAPAAGDVADRFRLWLDGALVTSFNVAFDRPFVERMGLDGLRWGPCVMERAMEIMGPAGVLRRADPSHPRYRADREWLWPSLAVSANYFGIAFEGDAHRALTDARVAAGIVVAIRRRAAEAA